MNQEQRQAYEWAKNQDYQSVAARYAKILAGLVDEIAPPNEWVSVETPPTTQGWYHVAVLDLKTGKYTVEQDLYSIELAKAHGFEPGFCKANRWKERERIDYWCRFPTPPEHILSLSYGKDSLACLGAIEQLGWPLDRIVHAEVWATDTIPADLPPMVEFKAKADRIIRERWGIEVEHYCSKWTFESGFYCKVSGKAKPKFAGGIRGWPIRLGQWCNRDLKLPALREANKDSGTYYLGIAADEPNRFHNLSDTKKSPLVEAGWTEADCRRWCEDNDLLSPIYATATRGGCWFCHNQGVGQLRLLRKNYPELWALMMKWDADSPVTFHADGHTVHDFDRRFQLEDDGLIYPDDKVFRWEMLDQELNMRWF